MKDRTLEVESIIRHTTIDYRNEIRKIVHAVSAELMLAVSEITGRSRLGPNVQARHLAMGYSAFKKIPTGDIARYFRVTMASVHYGVKINKQRIYGKKVNPQIKAAWYAIAESDFGRDKD